MSNVIKLTGFLPQRGNSFVAKKGGAPCHSTAPYVAYYDTQKMLIYLYYKAFAPMEQPINLLT
jgi:hypothetical protein